ncbi:hypothetical protein AB6D11_09715 [Vibrio splendidus]
MSKLTLMMAAQEYISRLRGKKSPKGEWICNTYFIIDKHKERERCCAKYENQIEFSPRVMWQHCKSIEHIANSYQVDRDELEKEVKSMFEIGRKRRKGNCSI